MGHQSEAAKEAGGLARGSTVQAVWGVLPGAGGTVPGGVRGAQGEGGGAPGQAQDTHLRRNRLQFPLPFQIC